MGCLCVINWFNWTKPLSRRRFDGDNMLLAYTRTPRTYNPRANWTLMVASLTQTETSCRVTSWWLFGWCAVFDVFIFLFFCIPRIPQFTRLEPYCSAAWALTTHNGSQRSGAQRYLRAVYLRPIATTRVLFCCSTNTQTKYTPHCIHTVCICKSREQDLPASL